MKQSKIKKIICIIIILMLCNFIIPSISNAGLVLGNFLIDKTTNKEASLLESISQFCCFLFDAIINGLQNMFATSEKIMVNDDTYSIKYSPGVIFSGNVPAFDINFINPTNVNVGNDIIEKYLTENEDKYRLANTIESSEYEQKMKDIENREYDGIMNDREYMYSGDYKSTVKYDIYYYIDDKGTQEDSSDDVLVVETIGKFGTKDGNDVVRRNYVYGRQEISVADGKLEGVSISHKSTAKILQTVIAKMYNGLRKVALVGLLSVVVYVGIRIVLTSTSAQDKAKYKKMLQDLIMAICLLFTLHYIMSITVTVVDAINNIVKSSAITAEGEDVLMTTVRNSIANGENWDKVLGSVVVYAVLAVYTIMYTVQYLRRTIHIAFLTTIAPLITLTYPLDKIKDGKAQAFDMWIKDYIYMTLLQVIHLLIYYIFLGSAISLNKGGHWIYAIVAIGFIPVAEKQIRKMFGFDKKSKSLGTLTAGATGALMMNAINQLGAKGNSSGGSAKGSSGKVETGKNTNIRTVGANPFVDFSEGSLPISQSSSSSPRSSGSPNLDASTNGARSTQSEGNSGNSGNRNTTLSSRASAKAKEAFNKNKKTSNEINSARAIINGTKALAKRYVPSATGTTIRTMTGVAGGIIGFSAATVDGDISKAISKTIIGFETGKGVANVTMNTAVRAKETVEEIPNKISETVDNVVDKYRESVYGEEVAQNAKFDREFRKSSGYRKLLEESGLEKKEFDKQVQTMLDEGISDTKQMKKILKNHRREPHIYSMKNSIKYSQMAEKCPEDILHNAPKFIRFCQDKDINIDGETLEELRKKLIKFK